MAEPATKRKREDDESMSGNASPSAAVAATVVTATTNSPLTTKPPPTANPPPTTNTSLAANSPPMTNPSLTANTTPTTNPSLTANPPPATNGGVAASAAASVLPAKTVAAVEPAATKLTKTAAPKPPPHMLPGDEVAQFLEVLDTFTPTIPDAVISHYLRRSGFKSSDPRVMRLISLATQKFVADIANDAMEYCKAGQATTATKKGAREKQLVLTSSDLVNALNDHGIGVVKPPYYA